MAYAIVSLFKVKDRLLSLPWLAGKLVQLASPDSRHRQRGLHGGCVRRAWLRGSDKPHAIEAYTLKELAADVVGIADALGHDTFITIGHDWGGPIALTTALLYPERVYATGSLSVPHLTRPPLPTLDLWREIYKDQFFYQLYFLNEGSCRGRVRGRPAKVALPRLHRYRCSGHGASTAKCRRRLYWSQAG